jgi:DNA-binding response OmpR family regulator
MNFLSILISYNDDNITELLGTIIHTRYNARIDTAKYESEFFDYTAKTDYDLILMDSSFAKDTFSVIEEFRAYAKNRRVPIALFISHLTEEFYKKAVELDIFDFLSRPFSLDHVYLALDYILNKKGYKENISNRRNSARKDKRLFIKYNLKGSSKKEVLEDHIITSENISVGGVRFTDNFEFSANDTLDIEVILDNPYDSAAVHATGIIKWAKQNNKDNMTVGVEFLNLNKFDRLRLNNTIYAYQ